MPDSKTPLPQHVQSSIQWHAHKYRETLRYMNPDWSKQLLDDAARNYSDNAIAQLGTYTWSVESIHTALRAHDPQLIQDLIIVRTDYDFGLSRALILVWSLRNEEPIKDALQVIAPKMLPIVYSTITDAISLGIPPEQWRPLWAQSVRRDHVVYVHDDSEYGDKAVAQAQRNYRDFKQQMAEILEGLRPIVATPAGAEMVADWFTLLAHDAEQLVRHYRAMPPGTLVPSSEAVACRSAVVEADLFGFARDAIAKYRARWEGAGAFDQLVLMVIGKLVDALPTYIAYVAKDWPGEAGLGAVISTAGAVIANTKTNGRLRRSLRAAAACTSHTRAHHELTLSAIPLVVADMPGPAPGTTPAQYMDALVKGVDGVLIADEQLELEKQTTIGDPATGQRVAARKSYSLEREIAASEGVGEESQHLDSRRLDLFPPENEVLARHAVMERLNQDHELWVAAKLSAREYAIKASSRSGYEPREIAEQLGTTANQVSVLKNRADRKIARVEERRRSASA